MNHSHRTPRHPQSGGITILVVFSMLVLMTVAALGMSRNSLREVFIVGSSRQSTVVRQAADSGLEYAILWSDTQKIPGGSSGAEGLQTIFTKLLSKREYQGISTVVPSAADMVLPAPADQSRSFNLKVLRMGKIPPVNTSQIDERLFNDLWVIQSSGRSTVGSTSFQHDKELWLTTTVRTN